MFSFCIFLMGQLMGGLDVACQFIKKKPGLNTGKNCMHTWKQYVECQTSETFTHGFICKFLFPIL